jgi:DNA-binding response OmpR family regulator
MADSTPIRERIGSPVKGAAAVHALIIEDQFLIAALIEDELRELGYSSFDVVDREQEAVAAAARRCPDLITADDRLTDGSGIEAVRTICAHQVIPVVFIVGNPHVVISPVLHAAVIGKPFGGTRLSEALGEARHLARRQLESLSE